MEPLALRFLGVVLGFGVVNFGVFMVASERRIEGLQEMTNQNQKLLDDAHFHAKQRQERRRQQQKRQASENGSAGA